MERKIFKKIVALLSILTILATDFFVLGSNLISYASAIDSSTKYENIEFSTYFKEGNAKVDNISKSIKSTDLKLYAEIKIKNEGYFNGSIELQESNFKIKNNILSKGISSIEGNKVNLKQINAGSTVVVELDIEPIIADTIDANMLFMDSKVKLTGEYAESQEKLLSTKKANTAIEVIKTVKANFEVDESAEAELVTDIITNANLQVKGEEKRVIQLLVKSRLTENQYPINESVIEVTMPSLSNKQPKSVEVLSLGTKATNGKSDAVIKDFKNENGKITINLKNEANGEEKITWNKNVYDELVVTLIYQADVDASLVEIETNSQIKLYNSTKTYTAKYTKGIKNKTLNSTITTQTENISGEIYKGQLYVNANKDLNAETITEVGYKTKTKLNVTNANITDKIVVIDGLDTFVNGVNSSEMQINTRYAKTEINKAKMKDILGENGSITIKCGTAPNMKTYEIKANSEANQAGNIEVNYEIDVNSIEITTSQPIKSGVIEFNHTKFIKENPYSVNQLKEVNGLKLKSAVTGTLNSNKVVENSTETTAELKETTTKVEMTLDKTSLSAVNTSNKVTMGVKLITDGVKYDLFNNPNIKIKFPSFVQNVAINTTPSKLYGEEFVLSYNQNVKNVIDITLTGKQEDFPEGDATQTYLQFDLTLDVAKLQPSKTDKIIMTYTNSNATQYFGGTTDFGIVEKQINVVSPSGLIPVNSIETYNLESIGGISENKQSAKVEKTTAGGTDVKYNISLINNTKTSVNNVKILGVLPTSGEFTSGTEIITNNLDATLKLAIQTKNATVYYSNNMNATVDTDNQNNGWSQKLSEVNNPKAYLIIIDNMAVEETFNASYIVTLPSKLDYDMTSYSGYQVLFNENGDPSVQKVESPLVGITTGVGIKLETNLSATVGSDILKNEGKVREGEVINYKVTVKNNGTETLENVVVKGYVPEGTVYVEPKKAKEGFEEDVPNDNYTDDDLGFVYSGLSYYDEFPNTKQKSETIPSLAPGEEYTLSYEVRVNMNIAEGTKITNNAEALYKEYVIDSNELTTEVYNAKLRVLIKRVVDLEIPLEPNGAMEYLLFIENMTDKDIKNVKFELITEGIKLSYLKDGELNLTPVEDVNTIDKISANAIRYYYLPVTINKENVSQITATLKVTDDDGNIYRANKVVDEVTTMGATVKLTSPNQGKYVYEGEEIIYNITVTNEGNSPRAIAMRTSIPKELEIQYIYVDGVLIRQTEDSAEYKTYVYEIANDFQYNLQIKQGKTCEIKLVTKVRKTEEEYETKVITNSAKVSVNSVDLDTSEEVTHIIRGNKNEDIKNIISGVAWLDADRNGQKDSGEKLLPNITVKLFDVSTNSIAKDAGGKTIETVTNENGEYSLSKIENGEYIVIFDFDRKEYSLTEYKKEGVQESHNSDAILKSIVIDGQEQNYAVTDKINVQANITNINIGLIENLIFDLELNKYISKISVQNDKGTKSYEFNNSTLGKAEIHRKQINNSIVVLEYTIKVTNKGEIAGNVNNIKDYLPSGLEFNSELNSNWYLLGQDLYTKSLANDKIQPGESRDIKLILIKRMTANNVGLINNIAEIVESYNDFGENDVDSKENNFVQGEDDMGAADVIIAISTGGRNLLYIVLLLTNTVLIAFAIYLIIKKGKKV